MSDHFDRYETRTPKSRENAFFRDLKAIVSVAKSRAAGLRKQIRNINITEIKRREDLERIPLLSKSDLRHQQAEEPPYGGYVAARPGTLRHVLIGCVEGQARDWWGAARALSAAGIRAGDVVLNCFSYHLSSAGHIIDSGAAALGCAVIPAGKAPIERQLDAIHELKPVAYCGKPYFLKQLLERAAEMNRDVSSIKRAFVFGAPLNDGLRAEFESRGITVREAYATSDLGVVAFECDGTEGKRESGMVLNEGLMLEIVKPGTGIPVSEGEIGEVVVTRINADYPLVRFATGDLSRLLPADAGSGRTNQRIAGWLGRVEQIVHLGERAILPTQVMEIAKHHAQVSRLRLVVQDSGIVLKAECAEPCESLSAELANELKLITGSGGRVEIVPPGTLPFDRKFIADERRQA